MRRLAELPSVPAVGGLSERRSPLLLPPQGEVKAEGESTSSARRPRLDQHAPGWLQVRTTAAARVVTTEEVP